ncbi:MAG: cysteine hydrolase family protein [Roseiarcus sp.]|jgi:nicotinamidase-related amidase
MAGLRAVIPDDAVLLPIDMQRGFDAPGSPALSSRPDAPALRLLAAWRGSGRNVVHVRHDSVEPGSAFAPGLPGNALRDGFSPAPGEALVTKSVNAAFIGTGLDLRLRRLGAGTIVAFGLTTDRCVSTTVRVGANMGYRLVVAADACAAFDQPGLDGAIIPAARVHAVHLATLANEFAEVASVADIVAALGRG